MIDEYKKLIEKSSFLKKENRLFLEKLKKVPAKELDKMTNQFHQEAFEKIDCLQCANCCTTTSPLLKERDIDRLSKHFKLKPGAFTEKYVVIDEDNDYVFNSVPCPFLQEDKCCSIYSDRPNSCKTYPHTDQEKIHSILYITNRNLTICPAVVIVVDKLKAALKRDEVKK